MVQEQDLDLPAKCPLMNGDALVPVEHLHRAGGQPHRQATGDVPGGHRVVALPHTDPGAFVDAGRKQPGRVERLSRQWHQRCSLSLKRFADGDRPAGDHPGVVKTVSSGDVFAQLGQCCVLGDWDQVPSAEPADLCRHAALLMGSLQPWLAEERLETVVRP